MNLKITGLFLFLYSLLSFAGYEEPRMWAVCDSEPESQTAYDLFYLYPTLSQSETIPLSDCQNDSALRHKTLSFAADQSGIFKPEARVFAPFVRQLEYRRALECLDSAWSETELKTGIADASAAFEYYLKHWNKGRKIILFGHSQGAIELYELLRTMPDLKDQKIVCAYLIGLPKRTENQINADFKNANLNTGNPNRQVVVWNMIHESMSGSRFTTPGGFAVNPLNGHTDTVKADSSRHLGAWLYDFRTRDSERKDHFCGVYADSAKGALCIDLPKKSNHTELFYHVMEVWFFAENLKADAFYRASQIPSESTPSHQGNRLDFSLKRRVHPFHLRNISLIETSLFPTFQIYF